MESDGETDDDFVIPRTVAPMLHFISDIPIVVMGRYAAVVSSHGPTLLRYCGKIACV